MQNEFEFYFNDLFETSQKQVENALLVKLKAISHCKKQKEVIDEKWMQHMNRTTSLKRESKVERKFGMGSLGHISFKFQAMDIECLNEEEAIEKSSSGIQTSSSLQSNKNSLEKDLNLNMSGIKEATEDNEESVSISSSSSSSEPVNSKVA